MSMRDKLIELLTDDFSHCFYRLIGIYVEIIVSVVLLVI